MSKRYLQQYDGYLKQHLGLIEAMHQAGADNIAIASRLYDLGVRAQSSVCGRPLEDEKQVCNLAAMVAYIRRTWFGRKPTPLHFWAERTWFERKPTPLHFWADP